MSTFEFNTSIDIDQLAGHIIDTDQFRDHITDSIENHIDVDDLAERVYEEIDMSDLADGVLDRISLDSEITDAIEGLLDSWYPESPCHTGRIANTAFLRAMKYFIDSDDDIKNQIKSIVNDVILDKSEVGVPDTTPELVEEAPSVQPFKYTDTSNNVEYAINNITLNSIVLDVLRYYRNIDANITDGELPNISAVFTHNILVKYSLNKKEG